jgi:hypothetical protein
VDAQGGAYATGVLVVITSAAVAVTLAARRTRSAAAAAVFCLIAVVFAYTTVVNIIERPDGVKIAAFFISAIVIVSLMSRVWRTTELRTGEITLDAAAERFMDQAARGKALRIIANQPRHSHDAEYSKREREQREDNGIPPEDHVLFLEIYVPDGSEFSADLHVRGVEVGSHQVLRAESAAVASGIAALLLYLRDRTGHVPHAYFSWTEGNPILLYDPLRPQWLRGCRANNPRGASSGRAQPRAPAAHPCRMR